MKMKKEDFLHALDQSRPRDIRPRSTVYGADKKQKSKKRRQADKKACAEY